MDAYRSWSNFYAQQEDKNNMWPSETLVRLMKGNYIPGINKEYSGKTALEIGFGSGNNLVFLRTLGLRTSGVEVDADICNRLDARLGGSEYECDLKVGDNRNLPFADSFFDYAISWNVIHYENSEEKMRAAISEYARVMKPGGRLFLSTVAPDNMILDQAESLGNHLYRIGREDFRKGQIYFYFDTEEAIHHYFGTEFEDILVGRTHDRLFSHTLDFYIVTARKKDGR